MRCERGSAGTRPVRARTVGALSCPAGQVAVVAAALVLGGSLSVRAVTSARAVQTTAAESRSTAGGSALAVPAVAAQPAACPMAAVAWLWGHDASQPVVWQFEDDPTDDPATHRALAWDHQVGGSVFGLAYDVLRGDLYVAAAHVMPYRWYSPGGPGQIFVVDPAGATARPFAVLDAGADRLAARDADEWVGRTGLGDIELDDAATTLFVANLTDRRIHRFAVPDGAALGSFAHGAAGEDWAADARPFALAWGDGWLYHGVVDACETRFCLPTGRVFRSREDGSEMSEVAEFDFGYSRRPPWGPWAERDPMAPRPHGQPLLTDLAVRTGGDLVLGIRDRLYQMSWSPFRWGAGDLLPAVRDGAAWRVISDPEFYSDTFRGYDEVTLGTLAIGAGGRIVASAAITVTERPDQFGVFALWFDPSSGSIVGEEPVVASNGPPWPVPTPSRGAQVAVPRMTVAPAARLPAGMMPGRPLAPAQAPFVFMGDIEAMCPPAGTPTPAPSVTPSPSATASPPPTASATASVTPTPTATATPTPRARPLYLPLVVRELCFPDPERADVVLVIDTSSSMAGRKLDDAKAAAASFAQMMDLSPGRDQVAVVRYDAEAEVVCRLTNGRAVIEAGIRNLTSRSGTHIDKGLRLALAELQSARRLERNLPVIVLLTDGIQTGTPGEELRAAADVRTAGVRLYTIGLGGDVDAAALRQMAGDESRYHFAPGSADLARIYGEIAGDILCPAPAGGFWPGR